MLMAHNPRNERIDFLYFFLNNVKNGSPAYMDYFRPILSEAKELVMGSKNIFGLSSESRDIKILLQEIAPEWLSKVDVANVSEKDISELQSIIKESENSLVF